jgi:4-hydroxy-tetrahydrodipicolinate synthase
MPFALDHFRGIFPAALTMFDAEGIVDEGATACHWEWLVAKQQADGLVILGTSGEFIALESEERVRLFRLATEVARGRVPVICGSGHYSTRRTIQMSQEAEKAGADAVIIILPYFQRPMKSEILSHYRALRREIGIPVMVYNNPHNSACAELTPREIAALVEEDVVHMVKSTFSTVEPVHDLRFLVGARMAIFYGSFLSAFEGLTAQADGWISGILNVVSRAAKAMDNAVQENDSQRAFEIWKKILEMVHLYSFQPLGPVSDLAIWRSVLDFWGLKGGYCARPTQPLTPEQQKSLAGILTATGWADPDHVLDSFRPAHSTAVPSASQSRGN